MNQLLEAAESAVVNQPHSEPDMEWIRRQATGRRRRRHTVTGAGSMLAVAIVAMTAWSVATAVSDRSGAGEVVAVEAAHDVDNGPDVNTVNGSPAGDGDDPATVTVAESPEWSATTTNPATSPESDDEELRDLYRPVDGCPEGEIVPLGQTPMAVNFEPLGSVWCFDLSEPPTPTAEMGDNSWVDEFTVDSFMHSFNDGDMGYRVFDGAGQSPGKTQHWINQNHWMVDAKGGFTGGSSLRPDRSFRFEDGRFVVEADFAAGLPEYGPNAWGELTITTAPEPTGVFADNLYAYGQFGGHWAVGCRLQPDRVATCAVEAPDADGAPDTGLCSAIPGNYRVSEMSFFQRCGTEVMGGYPPGGQPGPWRACEPAAMDMDCRDRFRVEITKDSLTLYVNGEKYMEDAGWPDAHQLPESFLNAELYVYQSNWQWRADTDVTYRFHWDHFAVNPSEGPTPSEWYQRDAD